MQVQVNQSQEEIDEQAKSWGTLFGCVAVLGIAFSFVAHYLLSLS